MTTATAAAYEYRAGSALPLYALKRRKAQKQRGFRAKSTCGHCIKDKVIIDPCMGSGHILVYMFDVLEQIYTSVGYSEREAAKAILENNIYGLDIDDRAYQLAYFAVMMKARQYNRRILTSGIKAHVYSIQESNGITKNQLQEMGENLPPAEKTKALSQAEKLVELFHDAKEYGSILNIPEMDWDLLRRFATPKETLGQTSLNWNQGASKRLMQLIDQGEVMAKKYWVTCTNPPYMTSSNMNIKLNSYLKRYYPHGKNDLFGAFIERNILKTRINGLLSMITMHSWMFLSRYASLRDDVLNNTVINMNHLGSRAFEDIGGEVVQTVAFVLNTGNISNYEGKYVRLTEYKSALEKEKEYYNKDNYYMCKQLNYYLMVDHIFAYWANQKIYDSYKNLKLLGNVSDSRQGIATGDNDYFLRIWFEVPFSAIKFDAQSQEDMEKSGKLYAPYNKGGAFRRWYGNRDYVIKISHSNYLKLMDMGNHLPSRQYYYHNGITWNDISTNLFCARIVGRGFVFDAAGPTCFYTGDNYYLLGFLNSSVAQSYLNIICQGLHYSTGHIPNIPFLSNKESRATIDDIVRDCIKLTTDDWNENETSWDFKKNVMIPASINSNGKISAIRALRERKQESDILKLKSNEELLNKIFIDIYGFNEFVSRKVSDENISISRTRLSEDIISLISYSIGCMFGRYSLDKEGLIYAGGDWKSVQSVYKSFLPDRDNVIPITDQKYLDDDLVERICEFLTVVYGADTLEENLDFIAKALGNKGLTSREVIRNYMLNDFFKDHCKTYSVTGSGKRPIYWLFDSGKENAFKALVYMHRWDADTTGRVLLYAQQIQQKYETEIRAIDMMLDHISDARQKSTEEKRQEHLKKQLEELVDYEERLEHMANERIAIDLDDGVKVNYEKVQTDRNGKKYQILAPIK